MAMPLGAPSANNSIAWNVQAACCAKRTCSRRPERAYRQHDAGLTSMQVDRLLRGLHDDPRWRRLREKMGFAE
jgi:hypothetical protein